MRWTIRDTPQRIVCLTAEPTEILYALGEDARVVGLAALETAVYG
jgi:iron complex transport system substrate-binding protein